MRHLAYWIYSQEVLQGGVAQSRLVAETSRYLQQRVFDDPVEAEAAASTFIEFCTGRAWVFTDTGTTSDGEKLYQFTHRTFLEYFSAGYLFSIHPTPPELLAVLVPRVAKQEWDVVAQLAFQIQSRNLEGAADKALSGLLERAVQLAREERWNVLLFALRVLESIVPSPAVRRAVVTAALRDLISISPIGATRRDGAFAVTGAIHAVSRDNRATVAETVEQLLKEIITTEGTSIREGCSAFELAYDLATPRMFSLDTPTVSTDLQYWSDLSSAIVNGHRAQLERFARQDLMLASRAYAHEHISIEQLLEWHGVKGIFEVPHSRTFSVLWPPLSIRLLIHLREATAEEPATMEKDLAIIGDFLVTATPPWVHQRTRPHYEAGYRLFSSEILRYWDTEAVANTELRNVTGDSVNFAVFAFVAVVLESSEDAQRKELVSRIAGRQFRFITDAVRASLVTRFQQLSGVWECSLGSPYKEVVEAWVRHEVSFVQQSSDIAEATPREPDQLDLDVVPGETSLSDDLLS